MLRQVIRLAFFAVMLGIYLGPSIPIEPFLPGPIPSYDENDELSTAKRLLEGLVFGPETIVFDEGDQGFYTGSAQSPDGEIIYYSLQSQKLTSFAKTGGVPLGLALNHDILYVADAVLGILAVTRAGQVTTIVTKFHNTTISADDLKVASNGDIFFSHCTSIGKEGDRDIAAISKLSVMSAETSGKILRYNAATKTVEVLIDNLTFANGVELSEEEDYLLAAETGRYRVHRYWLKGPRAGTSQVFLDNLPGFPDGVRKASNGRYWVAMFDRRSTLLDAVHPYPIIKKLLLALPPALLPHTEGKGFVLLVDGDGKILKRYDSSSGVVPYVTSVWERQGKLYLGTLRHPYLSVVDVQN